MLLCFLSRQSEFSSSPSTPLQTQTENFRVAERIYILKEMHFVVSSAKFRISGAILMTKMGERFLYLRWLTFLITLRRPTFPTWISTFFCRRYRMMEIQSLFFDKFSFFFENHSHTRFFHHKFSNFPFYFREQFLMKKKTQKIEIWAKTITHCGCLL